MWCGEFIWNMLKSGGYLSQNGTEELKAKLFRFQSPVLFLSSYLTPQCLFICKMEIIVLSTSQSCYELIPVKHFVQCSKQGMQEVLHKCQLLDCHHMISLRAGISVCFVHGIFQMPETVPAMHQWLSFKWTNIIFKIQN